MRTTHWLAIVSFAMSSVGFAQQAPGPGHDPGRRVCLNQFHQPYPCGPQQGPYPQPPYPQPNPPYPQPGYGACVISGQQAQMGFQYVVTAANGQVLTETAFYQEAVNTANQAVQEGYCSSVINENQPQPNPYYPPAPAPNPYEQSICTVQVGGDAYGNTFFNVVDNQGRFIANRVATRAQADQIAETDLRCFVR